jgi:hypothetical protein
MYLLNLREELIDIAIEFNLANVANWDQVFWPELGGVKNIKVKFILNLKDQLLLQNS